MKTLLVLLLVILLGPTAAFSQTNTWETKSSAGFTPRVDPASATVNNKIYVLGGMRYDARFHLTAVSTLEVYDPATDTWSRPSTTGARTPRQGLAATVFNGKIYAIGGFYIDTFGGSHYLSTLEIFDPATNTWNTPQTTNACTPRAYAVAAVINGRIYVVGGWANNSAVNAVDVFDPATSVWSTVQTTGEMVDRRIWSGVFLRGKFYFTGGWTGGGWDNSVEVFDPATSRWSHVETTGSFLALSSITLDTLGGKLFAFDGWDGSYPRYGAYVYDPDLRLWNALATTNKGVARSNLTSQTLGGKIYLMGGGASWTNQYATAIEAIQPSVPPFVRGTATVARLRLDFGEHEFLKDSTLRLRVQNASSQGVRLDSIALKSLTSNVFSLVRGINYPEVPYTLFPDSVVDFTLRYVAPSTWGKDSAELRIYCNLHQDSTPIVLLTGSSRPKNLGSLSVDRTALNFGTQAYPNDSTLSITLSNTSAYTAHLDAVGIVGANASQFEISLNSHGTPPPFDVSAGGSVTFNVTYAPPAREGTDRATLTVLFDDVPDSLRLIDLQGTAAKPLFIPGEHGTWVPRSSSGFTPRHALTSAVVQGKVYAIGGETDAGITDLLEVYDPATDRWNTPGTLGTCGQREFAAAVAYHDSIFVFGGYAGSRHWINTIDVYDPSTHVWATLGTRGSYQARDGLAAVVSGEQIYLLGGFDGDNTLDAFDVFDPSTRSVGPVGAVGTFAPRTGLTAGTTHGRIYAIGGIGPSNAPVTEVDVYDPGTNSWSALPTTGTFTGRELLGGAVLNDKIYSFGGTPSSVAVNTVEVLDPVAGMWTTPVTTGTFTARYGLTTAVVGDNIYAIGGYDGNRELSTNEMYTRTASVASARPESSGTFVVYPNPATASVTFDYSDVPVNQLSHSRLIVCDMLGNRKLSRPIENDRMVISIAADARLAPGAYMARIIGPSISLSTMFVVAH